MGRPAEKVSPPVLPSELTRKAQEQPKQKEPEKVLRLRPNELLRLAPRLRNYLQTAAPGWRDIIDAVDGLRHDLDVSKPLWGEACLAMGREQAAIALAIVSTKNPEYFKTTAGGYFHGMVAKAKRGELNLDRTIWVCVAQPVPLGAQRTSQEIDDINDVFSDTIFPRRRHITARAGR